RVEVVERGVDVALTIAGPDGQKIAESNNGVFGVESVALIATSGGEFRLEARLSDRAAPNARYQIRVAEWRKATEQDRGRVLAERVFDAGKQLHRQRTEETYRGALKKYEEALALYKAADDRRGEPYVLYHIGSANQYLNDRRKSLEYYRRALPLFEALADRKA